MATQNLSARMIAADHQRQRIPTEWLLVFDDMTNEALDSLSLDPAVGTNARTYAGWELEYRTAFGLLVRWSGPLGDVMERVQV